MLFEKNVRGAGSIFAGAGVVARAARRSSQAWFALVLAVGASMFLVSPLQAQDNATQPAASQPNATQQTAQQRKQEAKQMQSRRALTHKRRLQQVVNETYNHRFEIYTGGMYTRFRPGPYLHNAGTGGWALGLTDNLTSRWSAVGDARGYYGSSAITINNAYDVHNTSFSAFTFTAGPQYRLYKQQHLAISTALQAGIIYGYFDVDTNGFPPELVGLYPAGVVPAGIFSIHMDYNLSPGLAVRFSPNVLMTTFNHDFQHHQGFLMGVVYRFDRHTFKSR